MLNSPHKKGVWKISLFNDSEGWYSIYLSGIYSDIVEYIKLQDDYEDGMTSLEELEIKHVDKMLVALTKRVKNV